MAGYNTFMLSTEYDSIKKVDDITVTVTGGNFDLAAGNSVVLTGEASIIPGAYFEDYSTVVEDPNLGKIGVTGSMVSLDYNPGGEGHYDYRILIRKGVTPGKYSLQVTIWNQDYYGTTAHVPNFTVKTKVSLYLPASS
jgi:hypothetical protein